MGVVGKLPCGIKINTYHSEDEFRVDCSKRFEDIHFDPEEAARNYFRKKD